MEGAVVTFNTSLAIRLHLLFDLLNSLLICLSLTVSKQTLIPDGEIIGRPALAVDGSIIVGSARGTLNKVIW